jgi:predicted ArsR family transcriptional regulator
MLSTVDAAVSWSSRDRSTTISDAKRRVLDRLKRADGLTAGELAADLGITEAAVRMHLDALVEHGLVVGRDRDVAAARTRGRPPVEWLLSGLAIDLFPDRHADLTVELIEAVRAALGERGLDAVIAQRTAQQLDEYRATVGARASIGRRVDALATRRTVEGYMAEAQRDGRGWVLVEHHCPVCSAARACQGLCKGELELFQAALGDDVRVTREQHLLAGDARCAYRITPAS